MSAIAELGSRVLGLQCVVTVLGVPSLGSRWLRRRLAEPAGLESVAREAVSAGAVKLRALAGEDVQNYLWWSQMD
jgi:hypothetical protein